MSSISRLRKRGFAHDIDDNRRTKIRKRLLPIFSMVPLLTVLTVVLRQLRGSLPLWLFGIIALSVFILAIWTLFLFTEHQRLNEKIILRKIKIMGLRVKLDAHEKLAVNSIKFRGGNKSSTKLILYAIFCFGSFLALILMIIPETRDLLTAAIFGIVLGFLFYVFFRILRYSCTLSPLEKEIFDLINRDSVK